jgi:hypothetical protein
MLIACWVRRERARDHRLAGDDRCGQRQEDHRNAHHVRDHQEERVLDQQRSLIGRRRQDHRTLPHVVEHQRRQHEGHPADPDRLAPEMPHIGIKRLGPGYRQHNAAHRYEGAEPVGHEEVDRIERIDRFQNDFGMCRQVHQPEHCQCQEIDAP